MEEIEARTDKDCVLFLIQLGCVLNKVCDLIANKQEYGKWIRTAFSGRHERYFQHARQLASIKDFALKNADLGKARILELFRVAEAESRTCEDLLVAHPCAHEERKANVDSIITYYRLSKEIEFPAVQAIVAAKGRLQVGEAAKLLRWLQGREDRTAALAALAEHHWMPPKQNGPAASAPLKPSLGHALDDLLQCLEKTDEMDEQTIRLASATVVALFRKLARVQDDSIIEQCLENFMDMDEQTTRLVDMVLMTLSVKLADVQGFKFAKPIDVSQEGNNGAPLAGPHVEEPPQPSDTPKRRPGRPRTKGGDITKPRNQRGLSARGGR
jgi:hypothetical protein